MTEFSGRTVLLLCMLLYSLPNHTCRFSRKYLPLSRRIIENVTLCNYKDKFTEIDLHNEPNVEFKNSRFPFFGEEIIHSMNYTTKSLTFRRGSVREILISSPVLEVLQVINTDLVTLNAVPFLNYSLRQLTIRSSEFSRWFPSLTFLRRLEEIDIAYCNFSYLNMDWFEPLPKLRVLDVAKNKLTTLDIGPTLSMGALKKLHLWGNRLERLQRFPDAFPMVERVTLSQNRWHCDWLSKARDAILSMRVVLMDMDDGCQAGWFNNGGLCCRFRMISLTMVSSQQEAVTLDILVPDQVEALKHAAIFNESLIGMQMGNAAAFLDMPLVE
ncbi:toll-like receptor 4 [Ochlerotatus camptorhynchus]|uniref:toll-like receptor 4 n=1 Tax=Ochlerotatus camptorhynchus TaxID=644619 RepID=UPI0031D0A236